MTRLRLSESQRREIDAHLCCAYPEEGCGELLGSEQGDTRRVERVVPFANDRPDARANRYLIAPERLLEVEREGRASGLEILGFFHSHPDQPADPSAFDLEHAWPYYSYLIVSVEQGRAADARCWRLAVDRSRFEPEAVEPGPETAHDAESRAR